MTRRGTDKSKMRKEDLRKEAKERNEYWQSLGPKEQLKSLDKRLGKDQGATKQRAKIQARLGTPTETVSE